MILALLAAVASSGSPQSSTLRGGFQSTTTLDRSVAAFTGHATGEDGGARAPIDPRLRLASCPTVALSWRTPAQDAVVVTCTGPDWRLFVPVRGSRLTVATASPAAVAPVPIAKPIPVIKRGDPVLIEAGQDGFSITREGVAQADAAPGARLAVRIDGKPVPVQAVAIADGRVTLPGWSN